MLELMSKSVQKFAQKHVQLQRLWRKLLSQEFGPVEFKIAGNFGPLLSVKILPTDISICTCEEEYYWSPFIYGYSKENPHINFDEIGSPQEFQKLKLEYEKEHGGPKLFLCYRNGDKTGMHKCAAIDYTLTKTFYDPRCDDCATECKNFCVNIYIQCEDTIPERFLIGQLSPEQWTRATNLAAFSSDYSVGYETDLHISCCAGLGLLRKNLAKLRLAMGVAMFNK